MSDEKRSDDKPKVDVPEVPEVEEDDKDLKQQGNFGKDFARGDHPSRSGATYCAVAERDERKPKRWNGPGMKMLPPVYGESLHNHSKVVDTSEDWEVQPENNFEVFEESEKNSASSSSRSTMERAAPDVPVYLTEEIEKQFTCEEERLTEVVKKYQIYERSISLKNKMILWLKFTRANNSNVLVFLVKLNHSYYVWYEWFVKKFADNRRFKLPSFLTNPANCEDVLRKLNSMVKEKFEDLTLITVSYYDLLREIDEELADVLEVFHYNWKNHPSKIPLMTLDLDQ